MEEYRECWWSLALRVTCEWTTAEDFVSFAEKRARKAGGKCVYGSTHVELCSSREPAPLVPLPPISSPPTQKSTPIYTSEKFSSPFFEKNILRLFREDANSAVLHHDSGRAHTDAATVRWLKISAKISFLREIDPLTLPICRPWIVSWMEFSSADFGSGRHAARRDWNGPYARSGQKCLLVSVGILFWLAWHQSETVSDFFFQCLFEEILAVHQEIVRQGPRQARTLTRRCRRSDRGSSLPCFRCLATYCVLQNSTCRV